MATLLTNGGKANVAAAIDSQTSPPNYVGWGTGTGQTATSTDVATSATANPGGVARLQGTDSIVTTTVTNDTYRVVRTLIAPAARAVTEVGSFTASSGANMFIYSDFTVINLATDDSIEFTIDCKIS